MMSHKKLSLSENEKIKIHLRPLLILLIKYHFKNKLLRHEINTFILLYTAASKGKWELLRRLKSGQTTKNTPCDYPSLQNFSEHFSEVFSTEYGHNCKTEEVVINKNYFPQGCQ